MLLAVATASSLMFLKALLNGSNRYRVVLQVACDGDVLARKGDDLVLVGDLVDFAVGCDEDSRVTTLDALLCTCGIACHAGAACA
jgi:hypothetical protein